MRINRTWRRYLIAAVILGAAGGWGVRSRAAPPARLPEAVPAGAPADGLGAVLPLEAIPGLPPERVALGRRLFHDARLSADFSVACASCHNLGRGGVDGRRYSLGVRGAVGTVNAPTVFNSGYNLAQFWDGRAGSLEAQVSGPLRNPVEMGSSWKQALSRLGQDAKLRAAFAAAYPDGLTAANVANAIAVFERALVTPNSPFDRYLRGDRTALTPLEIDGYRRFREFGCTSCHQGRLLGGNMFQKFGLLADYFAARPAAEFDQGRFNVTHREADRHVFKVPGLRNVALTAPYFHDGSAATLEQAVSVMGRYQLGRDLSGQDVKAIVAFLKTLTGELPRAAQP